MTFETWVTDHKDEPVLGAFVLANDEMNGLTFTRSTDGRGYGDVAMSAACGIGDRCTVAVVYNGVQTVLGDALLITKENQVLRVKLPAPSFKRPSRPTVTLVPRGSLPSLPPGTYDRVLPLPPGRDLLFYRGQFCGLRVPGAPWVPGANDRNPECVMACLLDHYPKEIQDEFLRLYAGYGYTHLQRSWGHALPNDGWQGTSLDDFIALSKRAQDQYGLWADQWIIGGGALYNCNQDLSYWRPIIDQLCDALLAAKAIDTACVGWQLDQLFGDVPGNTTIAVIAYIADKLPQEIPLYTHWMNEALAWWKTGGEVWTDRYGSINVQDRFSWWRAMEPYLTGGHHQGNTTMAVADPKLYQDKMKDTLDPFGGDTTKAYMGRSRRGGTRPFLLTVFECTGQDQFDGKTSEETGDLAGYLLMCTKGYLGAHVAGYGNGARRPDGSVL